MLLKNQKITIGIFYGKTYKNMTQSWGPRTFLASIVFFILSLKDSTQWVPMVGQDLVIM